MLTTTFAIAVPAPSKGDAGGSVGPLVMKPHTTHGGSMGLCWVGSSMGYILHLNESVGVV